MKKYQTNKILMEKSKNPVKRENFGHFASLAFQASTADNLSLTDSYKRKYYIGTNELKPIFSSGNHTFSNFHLKKKH